MATATIKANSVLPMRSYADAVGLLGPTLSRRIAKDVTVRRLMPDGEDGERIAAVTVRVNDTNILTYYSDDTFSVDVGDHPTATMVRRLNQFGPEGFRFCLRDGEIEFSGFPVPYKGYREGTIVSGYRYPCKGGDQ